MVPPNVSSLPAEVIDGILHQIDRGCDRIRFSKTCRAFNKSFAAALIRHTDIDFEASPDISQTPNASRAIAKQWTSSIKRVVNDQWTSKVKASSIVRARSFPSNQIKCTKADCRACTLRGSLGAVDAFIATHIHNVPKDPCLTFQGAFGKRTKVAGRRPDGLEHQFVEFDGIAVLALKELKINMHWKYWDFAIFYVLSTSQLVVLKLPLAVPTDCLELALALVKMPLLKSLTITDMPDHPAFLDHFAFLGLGIRSRSASLRELDLSVTNFNRPDFYCDTWERVTIEQEPFVKPESLDYFFSAIFPASVDEISDKIEAEYFRFEILLKERMIRPDDCNQRLKLEKLRLKRIDLPSHSFEEIFDGQNLKELRLPFCDVAEEVWSSIAPEKLLVLENTNYEFLQSRPFKKFLHSQNSLRSLSFARPPDQYQAAMQVWYDGDEGSQLCLQPYSAHPTLGHGTEWAKKSCYSPPHGEEMAYPTLEEVLQPLSKANLQTLLLPADMYDITPHLVRNITTYLPSLHHLTWGFDYKNPALLKAFATFFLPTLPPTLLKITFLSLHLPSGYHSPFDHGSTFNAPPFHNWINALGSRVPQTIRYLRYRHLMDVSPYQGVGEKATVWYHRRERAVGGWWVRLGEEEGEGMFEEERTPVLGVRGVRGVGGEDGEGGEDEKLGETEELQQEVEELEELMDTEEVEQDMVLDEKCFATTDGRF